MRKYDIAIVGSGAAGAATAYFLQSKQKVNSLCVIEKEKTPHSGASGKSAGIISQLVETEATAQLAKKSVEFFNNPPKDFCSENFFRRVGGILTTKLHNDNRLLSLSSLVKKSGIIYEEIDRNEVLKAIPLLEGAPFTKAVFCKDDGIVDSNLLLSSFLKKIEVLTSKNVEKINTGTKKIKSIEAENEEIEAEIFVFAAGASSEKIAKMAGLSHIVLEARRRHLLISEEIENLKENMPYYWSLDPQLYFRSESKGLLLSPCDITAVEPEKLQPTAKCQNWLKERLQIAAPKMANLRYQNFWAELRTFTFDNNFLIGFDPYLKNLFWVSALQGYGITCSAGVGESASDMICGKKPDIDLSPHSPSRFK